MIVFPNDNSYQNQKGNSCIALAVRLLLNLGLTARIAIWQAAASRGGAQVHRVGVRFVSNKNRSL